MKTLLLCPELFARESGSQRIMRLYLKGLCESAGAGDTVDLLVLNDRALPAEKLAAYSDDHLGIRKGFGGQKLPFLWEAARRGAKADRLVCGHLGQLIAARLAHGLNPKLDYYLVAHGIEVWKPYSALERLAMRRSRRILCVSEYTRYEMQRRMALPDWRFAVVPNALDPYFTPPAARAEATDNPPVVLAVARLDGAERYKGIDHLIEAMPTVQQALPGTRLRIVGTGNDRPRLHGLAGLRGVSNAVEFTGFLDDEKLAEAYRDCSLFALPSHAEGFGLVFLEAMASGKPCLGARAGAIPELIDETSGVLVDYGNIGQLAAGLIRALTRRWDPERIKARAAEFSYSAFRTRLQQALASRPDCRPLRTPAG